MSHKRSGRRPKILVIDCQAAGISGDMLLGALVDLGANVSRLAGVVECIRENVAGCRQLQLEFSSVTRGGLRGRRASLKIEEEPRERTGTELEEIVAQVTAKLGLSLKARELARNAISIIAHAEAEVHGGGEGHLAELGSVDTVVDIIATAAALEDLGLLEKTRIYSTPVGVGSGTLKFSHGRVSIPAPVALEILRERKFPLAGQPVHHELATPTGVALLVSLVDEVVNSYPPLRPLQVGYGAGGVELPGAPNLLRLILGEPIEDALSMGTIYILETNVDDVPGEVVGHTMGRLLREGARDCCLIPMFTKKERPGQIIQVMAERENVEKLARLLFEELGTLGIRFYPCQRYVLARGPLPVEVMVSGRKERVTVKVARDESGKIVQLKPEYEEVRELAERSGQPVWEISRLIQREAWSKLTRAPGRAEQPRRGG